MLLISLGHIKSKMFHVIPEGESDREKNVR